MKPQFDRIILIANPKSSGDGVTQAKKLQQELCDVFPELNVELKQTQHPGHAGEIAARIWKRRPRTLFISVSGDGGYHDMVNGLMRAAKKSRRRPLCAIHGAGYGNDHQRSVRGDTELIKSLKRGSWRPLDLLKIETQHGKKRSIRYAHSYVGFGITGDVAGEIDKTRHTWTPQWLEAARGFAAHEPVTLALDGNRQKYHSVLVLNVKKFAKVLEGAENTSAADGKFEVIVTRARGKEELLFLALQALVGKLGRHPQRSTLRIDVPQRTEMQFDGEPETLAANTTLRISSARHAVRTL